MYTGKRGYIDNINILWHLDYWDGMISAVCEVDGYKVYVEQIGKNILVGKHEEKDRCHSENILSEMWFSYYEPSCDKPDLNEGADEPGEYTDMVRFYYVFDVSPEGMDILVKRNDIWEKYIGTHCRYVNNSRRWHFDNLPKHDFNIDPETIKLNDEKAKLKWKMYDEETKDLIFDKKKETIFKNRIGYFNSDTLHNQRKANG